MKIACISDIHGMYNKVVWPRADLLIMAGDICPNHSRMKSSDATMQGVWLESAFVPMCQKLIDLGMYSNIVVVPGNHDRVFQAHTQLCREALGEVPNLTLLIDEGTIIDGKFIWGSPWTPWFHGKHWAFNFPDHKVNPARARAHARNCWELIPSKTDILVTHGPPFSVLDTTERDGFDAGCPTLAEEVFKRVKPQLHVFGHIHEGYGQLERDGIRFVNAACSRATPGNYETWKTLSKEKQVNKVQVIEL